MTLPDLLQAILNAAQAGITPTPERAFVQPGTEVAWDDCCDGQLALRLIHLEPVSAGSSSSACAPAGWKAHLGLGLIRCVASLDDAGNPPTSDQLTADAIDVLTDASVLEQVLTCTVSGLVDRLTLVNYLPLGPSGGCAGGEWTFRVVFIATPCGC